MTEGWKDYAHEATRRWIELGLDADPLTFGTGIRLERVARQHEAMLNDSLTPYRPSGVRGMEDFRLLALLARSYPATTSATAASKVLGLSKAATAARLERFVSDGLAEKSESQYDKRTVQVHASDAGVALAAECGSAIALVHERLFHTIDEVDLRDFNSVLVEITARFV